jgi:glycosyltransferase-like protein
MTRALRVALLTHSTNARGGVVHALELAAALDRLGHTAVVHAPDPSGRGFVHASGARTVSVPAGAAPRDLAAMVEARAAAYVDWFAADRHREFDVFHAQDGISGNALATLRERGLIAGFARTIHHTDDFADPRLMALQHRSIAVADQHFVVSAAWASRIAMAFGSDPVVVGNGVDTARFAPKPGPEDALLRRQLGLREGPVLLSVGGIEPRKNSIATLEAFRQVHALRPTAQWVIAGGASVLDHQAYQAEFRARLDAAALPAGSVVMTGALPDAQMPALYRAADLLVFASLREGFGLAVLEAMASGRPVVVPHQAPFTEYLNEAEAVWCNPLAAGSIANAVLTALTEPLHGRLAQAGLLVAHRHGWLAVARAHEAAYARLSEPLHA